MLKSLRIFRRNIFLTTVSVIGFSFGLSLFLYINSFVFYESSADKQHSDSDLIYRVSMDHFFTKQPGLPTLGDMDQKIIENVPEVEAACHLIYPGKLKVKINDEWTLQNQAAYCDSSFFKIFNYKLEKLHRLDELSLPNVALVSREFYERNFAEKSSGELPTLFLENDPVQIIGTFEPTGSTHINLEIIFSKATLKDSNPFSTTGLTYIKTTKGVDRHNLLIKLNENSGRIIPYAQGLRIYLENLDEVYYYTLENPYSSITNFRNKTQLETISLVGFFVMAVALLNLFSLSYSEAVSKIKQIKIKKILGHDLVSIIKSFLGETLILFAFSIIISLGFIYFSIDIFNTLINSKLTLGLLFSNRAFFIAGLLFILSLVVRMMAYLMVNSRVSVSLTSNDANFKGIKFLNGFLVFQIAFALVLFFSSFLISERVNGYRNSPLGFRSDILVISNNNMAGDLNKLKHELNNKSNLKSSLCSGSPFDGMWFSEFEKEGSFSFGELKVDDTYFDVIGVRIDNGRALSYSDSGRNIVVNHKFIEMYSRTNRPIGLNDEIELGGSKKMIVGIAGNIVLDPTPNAAVIPICFSMFTKEDDFIEKKLIAPFRGSFSNTRDLIDNAARNHNMVLPEITSVQEQYALKFKELTVAKKLTWWGSIISTCLLVLGMIAFLTYVVEKRSREIGVRRVIGATAFDIVKIFIKRVTLLYLIGLAVSIPLTYFFVSLITADQFGEVFELGWRFAFPCIAFLTICLLTILFQLFKITRLNPVHVLKNE